ncbi:phosphatidate cytidylyltransferase [Anaerolineales bacterium HSG24]|nr:phosphatidate cytidylyltransferase [Anaerolineales bacterium HSG24]
MFRTRLASGLLAMLIAFFAVYLGEVWFLVGAWLVAMIAGWEFGKMMKAGGYHTTPLITLALITLLLADSYRWPDTQLQLIVTFVIISALVGQLFRKKTDTPTADWALTIMGGLYVGLGLAHLVALRQLADGAMWVTIVFISTWGSDTLAYSIGRQFGKHKIWPRHSPKKTVEGFVGGILGGVIGALLVGIIFPNILGLGLVMIGAIIPIVAFLGDICESMLKRDTGIKDSSNLFPGHGGFLDRVDSLLFVSIVVYYFAVWIG